MANNKKTKNLIIIFVVVFVLLGMLGSYAKSLNITKHPLISEWYDDQTGNIIDEDEEDTLLESMRDFYDITGVQPYVLVISDATLTDRERAITQAYGSDSSVTGYLLGTSSGKVDTSAARAYDRLFNDEEHVLINIVENHGAIVSWDEEEQRLINVYNDDYIAYSVEVYAGSDSLKSNQLNIVTNIMRDMDLEYGIPNTEELIIAFERANDQLENLKTENTIVGIIAFFVSIIPTFLFVGFIILMVKIANKANRNTSTTTAQPYPTPSVKTIVRNNPTAERKVIPIGQPITINPEVTKPVAPAPAKPVAPTQEPISIAPLDPLEAITPIESIKIEPVSFDLEANNILDNLGDANYDVPNVIKTDFDDWGNL
ncbi:MAG: hypothetical protein MJ094_07400 [Saccharofermentans sp.]|nr:hypothetical protein [Saccharofermentans sp.]